MTIPLYISIPLIVAFVHYDNYRRFWPWVWARARRWNRQRERHHPGLCRKHGRPRDPEPQSQIVLPNGKVMQIGVTSVETRLAVDDVLSGSADFFILNEDGAPTMGHG